MANYTNPVAPAWPANVRRLSATDPADATGEESPDNKTGFDLVARTQNLKDRLDALNVTTVGATDSFGDTVNDDGSRSLTVTHNLGSTGYGVDCVPVENPAGTWGEWWLHTRSTNSAELRTNGSYSGEVRITIRRTTTEIA